MAETALSRAQLVTCPRRGSLALMLMREDRGKIYCVNCRTLGHTVYTYWWSSALIGKLPEFGGSFCGNACWCEYHMPQDWAVLN